MPSQTSQPNLLGLVERYYRTIDRRELDAMLDLFHEDVVYARPGYEPLRGKQALERFYRSERVIESGKHVIGLTLQQEEVVVAEGRFQGVIRGGETADVKFVDIFSFREAKIAERRTYFDSPRV